jgi:hypothetical protein
MRKALALAPGWLFAFALLWGIVAGVAVFTTAGGSMVSEGMGAPPQVRQISWYEMQGWWGIAILFIFAALFYAPWHFLRRGSRWTAALFAFVGVVLTLLTGFSVGGYYFIGALALLFGLLTLLFAAAR